MKGIILAGGHGTRLYPITLGIPKHLVPVFDKPIVYYPLALLLAGGIRQIALVVKTEWLPATRRLLGTGEQWDSELTYFVQDDPRGIPEAFAICERWLAGDACALALGDNLFAGQDVWESVDNSGWSGAICFASEVCQPERYGVVRFDSQQRPLPLIEKPAVCAAFEWAITGFYLCDASAIERARTLRPSSRGITEIVDLLNDYQAQGQLSVKCLPHVAWFDMGDPQALLEAAEYVAAAQKRTGKPVGCPQAARAIGRHRQRE